ALDFASPQRGRADVRRKVLEPGLSGEPLSDHGLPVEDTVTGEALLNAASKRLEELQEREKALDHLLTAMDEIQQKSAPVMEGLATFEEALQNAREKGVAKDLKLGEGVFLPCSKDEDQAWA
ncbi:unnamed protein product, partial [Cladocopium goreaui]